MRLIKKKRKRAQINKIANEKEVRADIKEIQNIIIDYSQYYIPINGQSRRNGQILRKLQSPKTELRRNRKYEQTNHKC